jgi:hypothetical protein
MGTSQMSVEKADPDLLERVMSNAVMSRSWITGANLSSSSQSSIINMAVELIAITDVYPLKHLVDLSKPAINTEYLDLIELKMRFFDKVISHGNRLTINNEK